MDNKADNFNWLNFSVYMWALIIFWTGCVVTSLLWNTDQQTKAIFSLARMKAKFAIEKDILYRRWISSKGGAYIILSEATPSNPYLKVPNRDVTTNQGQNLTLVNPAYMTRQVNEMAKKEGIDSGHITSLKPIRPENLPDPWETEALKAFEKGAKEIDSIESSSGKPYFRQMRAFFVEESCMKCHADQGYKIGDVRGGISVSIPMEPLYQVERNIKIQLLLAHSLLWLLGIIGIVFAVNRVSAQVKQIKQSEEKLKTMSLADELTNLYNRRGFFTLAQRQMKVAERTKKDMLLFFVDLDKMKVINDTLGHQEGDKALIEVSNILKEVFRESDIIGRMGGDEFAVLAIDTANETKEVLVNRLHNTLNDYNRFEGRSYQLSLSIGVAHYNPETPSTLDELMAQADELMYEEKRNKKH